MAGKLKYELDPTFPWVPKDILLERINKLSRRCPETGCWIWEGTRQKIVGKTRPGGPLMRIKRADGKSINVLVHRITYWMAHGVVLQEPLFTRHGCGNRACIEPEHLQLTSRGDLRNLTEEQVYQARLDYYGRTVPIKHRKSQERRSAFCTAADELGLSAVTIERVIRGGRVNPKTWVTPGLTIEIVKDAYARHVRAREEREALAEQTPSIKSIAEKYGLSVVPASRMLMGISYRNVPMPPTASNEARRAALSLYEIKCQGRDAGLPGEGRAGSTRAPCAVETPSVAQATA